MRAPLLKILAPLGTAAIMLASSAQAYAQSSKLIQNMDVNKDGKITRDEIPEGATKRLFDNMVEKYKLDPKKTYTIAEFEQAAGMGGSAPSSPNGSNQLNSNSSSRFGGSRRSFGPSPGSGPSRYGLPSRAPDGRPSRGVEELPEPYRTYDKDGDGQIGLYEWPRDRIREFVALDVNDDGFLTINELKKSSNGGATGRETPKEKKDEAKNSDQPTSSEQSTN
jgi:Ca2+-binding EF-hand superfamily protein